MSIDAQISVDVNKIVESNLADIVILDNASTPPGLVCTPPSGKEEGIL